ncbi:Alpha-ketoglutarate-dependent dioxygenase alkB 2 [Grifola frondosa]|uniref:Alpha-ketoglutarate-dependent dioxygenase alkB 2 n=1 Tax=Grifola frondosa TaxID=5627 RepID=A0A1C7M7V3_GRIFR|nr:Alpha-ketoglutarate-dependent dioxygenase alkB 2 [Grifola frondosa]
MEATIEQSSPSRDQARKDERIMLGPGDKIGEGDCYVVLDFLPPDLADHAFENLCNEVRWSTMYHRGGEVPRLVAVEGEVNNDGSFPIYRHPADESPALHPFSPTVARIRAHVAAALGAPVNHVLIQDYRSGADYISEHSDKTIDVVRGSHIVNVSLGAQRVMTLRTKKDALTGDRERRAVQRVPLPHNSMFVMGLETNARWMHGIRRDQRLPQYKSDAERAEDGERISLTLRTIGTFLTPGRNAFMDRARGGRRARTRMRWCAVDRRRRNSS